MSMFHCVLNAVTIGSHSCRWLTYTNRYIIRTMASNIKSMTSNRLIKEKSPYLLQHAHNPVDWYPWGQEAFDKAKDENKIIFLSVGYSTCHWCHVMERESFEDEEIGKILSDNFVPIKVDREERPDVDKVYMTFVQAMTGGGGWPMSVWLTPDLQPIVGGTYFPPNDRYYGRPGFKSVLRNILAKWNSDSATIVERGGEIVAALTHNSRLASLDGSAPSGDPKQHAEKCRVALASRYDEEMGGFGKAPKFPQPSILALLLRVFAAERDSDAGVSSLQMALTTLRKMYAGGMHDHVGQGFHRYSTDREWHVPHFEKMLYDQAQLAAVYADAFQITHDAVFEEAVRDILTYVMRDLSHQSGGFYSAEDADSLPSADASKKQEGAFCVWTHAQIQELLGQVKVKDKVSKADVFCHHYGLKPDGNVDPYKDPHDELLHQNVLIVRGDVHKTAQTFDLDLEVTQSLLRECRQVLYEARQMRPKPHCDTKMVTAWNGLMLTGLSRAAAVLNESAYRDRALATVAFLRQHAHDPETGELFRAVYVDDDGNVTHGPSRIRGFADDYAFLIRGLLDLYECCYDDDLLRWANELQEKQDTLFWDEEGGGYFSSTAGDANIVIRMKEDQDGAEPSANSVAAGNLLRLCQLCDAPPRGARAQALLAAFSPRLTRVPAAVPEMCSAALMMAGKNQQIIIVGDPESEDTKALLRCVHSHFLPNKHLLVAAGNEDCFLSGRVAGGGMVRVDGKATAYVCQDHSCSRPVTNIEELEALIQP